MIFDIMHKEQNKYPGRPAGQPKSFRCGSKVNGMGREGGPPPEEILLAGRPPII